MLGRPDFPRVGDASLNQRPLPCEAIRDAVAVRRCSEMPAKSPFCHMVTFARRCSWNRPLADMSLTDPLYPSRGPHAGRQANKARDESPGTALPRDERGRKRGQQSHHGQ